ncbi:glycosyltransferase family 2 protein [Aeromonas veronii]
MISIVIPFHNASKFILSTLSAIFKGISSESDIELIAIFDNCDDNSKELFIDYMTSNGRAYKFRETSYGGPAECRNLGIDLSSGEYVIFCDHDDIIDSTIFKRVAPYTDHEIDVIRFGFTINRGDNNLELVEVLPDKYSYPFHGIFVWNSVIRKSFLIQNDIKFKPGYGEDYEFNLELLKHNANEIRLTGSASYYTWQIHDSNLHKKKKIKDVFNRFCSIINNHGDFIFTNSKVKVQFVMWVESYLRHLVDIYGYDEVVHELSRHIILKAFVEQQDFVINKPNLNIKKTIYKIKGFLKPVVNKCRTVKNIGVKSLLKSVLIEIQNNKISKRILLRKLDSQKPKVLIYTFRGSYISGGLISIYSISEQLKINGYEVIMIGEPGPFTCNKNDKFPNNEWLIPASIFLQANFTSFDFVLLPEVKVNEFITFSQKNKLTFNKAIINILNQNIELMPGRQSIAQLKMMCKKVTMTTAHEHYSTQAISNKFSIPLKHISTYLSFSDYNIVPFKEKNDVVLYSPDVNVFKNKVLSKLSSHFTKLKLIEIKNISYAGYKVCLQEAKYSISFGEGLDNYYIEPFFTGGIGFTIFNPQFMDERFLLLDNVFSSYAEMERSICDVIARLESDNEFYKGLHFKNYSLLASIYDEKVYVKKIQEYLKGNYDYVP